MLDLGGAERYRPSRACCLIGSADHDLSRARLVQDTHTPGIVEHDRRGSFGRRGRCSRAAGPWPALSEGVEDRQVELLPEQEAYLAVTADGSR